MYSVSVAQLIGSMDLGIYSSGANKVNVCGSRCPDRATVAIALREAGITVEIGGCHGSIGGCAINGELESGCYATVPERTERGIVQTEVIVRPR